MKIPTERPKPTTKCCEKSKTAATVSEKHGFQHTQDHVETQPQAISCRNTSASKKTAACAMCSVGFHEKHYRKASSSVGKSEGSEKSVRGLRRNCVKTAKQVQLCSKTTVFKVRNISQIFNFSKCVVL